MSKTAGYALVITGFLACPCHLVFTLPLLAAVLSGTALGAFLAQNEALVFGLAFAYFLAAIGIGLFLINAKRRESAEGCSQCEPEAEDNIPESAPITQESSPLIISGRGSSWR